jgi:hypothetical protein
MAAKQKGLKQEKSVIGKISKAILMTIAFIGLISATFSTVKITVEHNAGYTETKEFKFKDVPSPAKDDAAAKARIVLVDGQVDGNSAPLSALTDGLLPTTEDDPQSNFFFDEATSGGRFMIDLNSIIDIAEVNTYSWHPNTRGPQVYKLYASDGTDAKFDAGPKLKIDPVTRGWKLIANVDTRSPKGDDGGQYGVRISDATGLLGKYRYLLFDCVATETGDDFGNTFYSEIDVIAKKQ